MALTLACQEERPSAESIARTYPEFYFKALPLSGLHVDHDTDAILFRYSVAQNEGPEWLRRISDSARAHDWKVVHESQSAEVRSLHLQRIDDPERRYRDMHSLEILRITSCGTALLIGGIQVDVEEQSDLAKLTADGGRWYRRLFWPLVAKYRAETCGNLE